MAKNNKIYALLLRMFEMFSTSCNFFKTFITVQSFTTVKPNRLAFEKTFIKCKPERFTSSGPSSQQYM